MVHFSQESGLSAVTSAEPGVIVCSAEKLDQTIKNRGLPAAGHPVASCVIAVLGAAVLLSLVALGLLAWARAGFSLANAHVFMSSSALGVVVGAMLGVIAAGVYQPSLLAQSVVSLMFSGSATRLGDEVHLDVRKLHRLMDRLQKIGQSGWASVALASASAASLAVGAGVAWAQWPGLTLFVAAPVMAGISAASLILGIIGASLFGLAAMVAGNASDIRIRAAIGLARLRAMEAPPALANGLA